MNKDFESKAYRDAFVEEFVRTGVAFQIRALRDREKWSQTRLGKKADTTQTVISRLESPDYGNLTVNTLLTLASAFDVALLVRFVSFSDLVRATNKLSPEDLAVPRYNDEKQVAFSVSRSTAAPLLTTHRSKEFSGNRLEGTAEIFAYADARRGTSEKLVALA